VVSKLEAVALIYAQEIGIAMLQLYGEPHAEDNRDCETSNDAGLVEGDDVQASLARHVNECLGFPTNRLATLGFPSFHMNHIIN
jgi:hypothetical protein